GCRRERQAPRRASPESVWPHPAIPSITIFPEKSVFSTRPWSSAGSEVGQERPCLLSQTNQFRDGMELELPHQPTPVQLHGRQGDAQAGGDPLVGQAGGDEKEHLALPGLQGAQELPDPAGLLLLSEPLALLFKRLPDRRPELLGSLGELFAKDA